jgi:hypothetical protein
MEYVENKAVIFDLEMSQGEQAYIDEEWTDWKIKLNKFQLIKAILFEKGFISKLGEAVKYGLIHSDCYRGENASEIVIFRNGESFDKLWYTKKVDETPWYIRPQKKKFKFFKK